MQFKQFGAPTHEALQRQLIHLIPREHPGRPASVENYEPIPDGEHMLNIV
jgi:hypothetical protein